MNIAQIETNLQELIKNFNVDTFIYKLLIAYGLPKASIARLQKGNLNLAKTEGEIIWKNKLHFNVVRYKDMHAVFDALRRDPKTTKHEPRFIVVTDYKTLLAFDTKTSETLDIQIKEITRFYDFFLPWAGMEKAQHHIENPADVKAAERMAKLYDEIKKDNLTKTPEDVHDLNVFLTRLLFCFFAEDTSIFTNKVFTDSITSHTQPDGSDLHTYIEKLFDVLNTEKRKGLPAYLDAFPYVNGGLFRDKHKVPVFTRRSRQLIIESGELNWSAINPDIFGSMIQAVVTPENRSGLGMHYTSVPNIMKVIEPLFLNELYEEFEKSKNSPKKLNDLLSRIAKIKIFDPACGSGNFLIIAYKQLRILEIKIIKQMEFLQRAVSIFDEQQTSLIPKAQLTLAESYQPTFLTRIQLSQFYGIEIDDFAHEVAILSLWLAEHQMNVVFNKEFGRTTPSLPLKDAGKIVHGNATRLDWVEVCTKNVNDEIYILGNPPYLGARLLSEYQKNDMYLVFNSKLPMYNDLDYVACWFAKGSEFIKSTTYKCAFVSTNSICQGSQVADLWPYILNQQLEIDFAHQSFKWTNHAKAKAAIICVIVGIRTITLKTKFLFKNDLKQTVRNISPYLTNNENSYVTSRTTPISQIPRMCFGSMANDGGFLLLNHIEYTSIVEQYPSAKQFLKKILGAKEFINGIERWCIWTTQGDVEIISKIPPLMERIVKVQKYRDESERAATNKLSERPYRFGEVRHKPGKSLIVPKVSSERREYIPIGFLDGNTIISDLAFAVYEADEWVFGLTTSAMHMIWVRTVAGRLKTDYRYSAAICYNTFPVPNFNSTQKIIISEKVFKILEEREKHSEKTLAQIYDPDDMPAGLREAHQQLDLAVERCYRSKPFETDEERLEYLFKLYEKMIAEEKEINGETTLFDEPAIKKPKRKQHA